MPEVGFYFARPWWLLAGLLAVPAVWWGLRGLGSLGAVRRGLAVGLRALGVLLLASILGEPMLTRRADDLAVLLVVDRSQSVPAELAGRALDVLETTASRRGQGDRLGVIDTAEHALLARLPGPDADVPRRNTTLTGRASSLAAGVQLALAVAPPDAAARVVLVSDGNETAGDLLAAARQAAAEAIPIDVLPLRYRQDREVVFTRLAVPARASSRQTVPLRMVLHATAPTAGQLSLSLNGQPVDLDPDAPGLAMPVTLRMGVNVQTVSVPLGATGLHEFAANFTPYDPAGDRQGSNNRAVAMTMVSGPGVVRIFETGGEGEALAGALQAAGLAAKRQDISNLPSELPRLADTDAVVLANVGVHHFSLAQQDLLGRYVSDLGGGLVMIGGPEAFGAGGWIGSPVGEVLPVDLDPPQKKQMPLGALVLVIDHSGSMMGRKIEIAKAAARGAVTLLSRRDLLGVVLFDDQAQWLVPFGPASDKNAIAAKINSVQSGGGTAMGKGMKLALEAIAPAEAGVKHVILLTDGQTLDPPACAKLAGQFARKNITVTTVAVGPDADKKLLFTIAQHTKGRFYPVTNPQRIPKIFIKEAQVVRRALIVEKTVRPKVVFGLSEVLRGFRAVPDLTGYILTGARGGLNRVVLATPDGDPLLATGQHGLGRSVAFTSTADARWAGAWVGWGGYGRFWEQAIRWAGKPSDAAGVELLTSVQGRDVTVTVETLDRAGRAVPLGEASAAVIGPEMSVRPLALRQVGPGRYTGRFTAAQPGAHLVTLRTARPGSERTRLSQAAVVVPFAAEFRALADNAAALAEVARLTGGRVLPGDPDAFELYDRTGIDPPQSVRSLRQNLLIALLAVFLLDVAVRRLALDPRASLRKLREALAALRNRGQADATVTQLRARRQALRQRWKDNRTLASRRYQPDPDAEPDDLPHAKTQPPPDKRAAAISDEPHAEDSPTQTAQPAHLGRLLNAKAKTRQRLSGKDDNNET